MKIKAYAKINLRLKVLGITDNSYHLLQMVNSKIGLYDGIIIKKVKEPIIDINMPYISKEDNLVYKVVKKMFEIYNLPNGIMIKIKKNIPIGAGLAGGSTDAASVMIAISKIYKLNISIEELRNIALEFGTDIVYCLENKLALVEGIGEKITTLDRKIKSDILIINPNINISTKEIFNLFDENKNYSSKLSKEEIENLPIEDLLSNDLEEITFSKYQDVREIKKELKEKKIENVLMTGSGSTVFVLGKKKELKKIYNEYKEKGYYIYLTKIINK